MFAQGSTVIRVEFELHHLGYKVESGFNNAGNGRLVNPIIGTWQRPKAYFEKMHKCTTGTGVWFIRFAM